MSSFRSKEAVMREGTVCVCVCVCVGGGGTIYGRDPTTL